MISPLQEGSAVHLRDPVLRSSHSFSSLSGTGSTGEQDHARVCPSPGLLVPLQQQWCGEEGERAAVGSFTAPSPDLHGLQAVLILRTAGSRCSG